MPEKFSEEELKNIGETIPKVLKELDLKPELRKSFLANPFNYLKERFNIFILKRFSEFKVLIEGFNKSVQDLFQKAQKFFTPCLACKFTTLTLTFGSMSHFQLTAFVVSETLKEVIEKVVDGITFIIHGNSEKANKITIELEKYTDLLSPLTLSTRICMMIGFCIDSDETAGK